MPLIVHVERSPPPHHHFLQFSHLCLPLSGLTSGGGVSFPFFAISATSPGVFSIPLKKQNNNQKTSTSRSWERFKDSIECGLLWLALSYMKQWLVSGIKKPNPQSYRWPFPWVVCFLPVGMCRLCERGVVITCVPGTALVGKQVYFYQEHIVEKMERERKAFLECVACRISRNLFIVLIQMFGFVCF